MTAYFDLGLVGYPGYKMDKDGGVYSTKRSTTPQKMFGSGPTHNKSYTLSTGRTPQTVSGFVLKMNATQHASWSKTFAPEAKVEAWPHLPANLKTKQVAGVKDRSHATSVEAGIGAKGSVIARVMKHDGKEILVFGSAPAIHLTDDSVKAEMTRLATDHPGVKYVALKIGMSLVSGGLQWA
jgi:hypothetical protein